MTDIQNDESLSVLKDRLQEDANKSALSLLKTASIDTDFGDIVDSAFADQENRMFPIFSPEMAAMSAMYMQGQDVDPLVKEACDEALVEWGVTDISTGVLEKQASDSSIPDELFLLPESKKLPVVDEASLYKSASALSSNLNNLTVSEKVEASTRLYKIATIEYGVSPHDMSEDIVRYALEAPCDLNKLAMAVTERYAETHEDEYKSFIVKIASLKEELDGSISFDKSVNAGIAFDLFALDKTANIDGVFDAVYDVFNTPFMENSEGELEKSASQNSIVVGNYSIVESELYKIAEEDVESAFPGMASSLFENGVMSIEKIETATEELSSSAMNALGGFLSGL